MNQAHQGLAEWLLRLYGTVGTRGDHERPHKLVFRLAILDLVESWRIQGKAILPGDELVLRFRELFAVVALRDG